MLHATGASRARKCDPSHHSSKMGYTDPDKLDRHREQQKQRVALMPRTKGSIHIGVGGWTFEPWRGSFYPPGLAQKRELEYASRKLTSIEINGTYYRTQTPESFARWHDETPEDFVFCVKGPRFATNRRVLAEAGSSIERFFKSGVMELKKKLGPINWQFMPSKKFDPADFEAFLKLLPTSIEGYLVRHAVEVRHESFCSPEFIQLLRVYSVAAVIAGDSKYPQIGDLTTGFVYARIMGTRESVETGYTPGELDLWADRARAWSEGRLPKDVRTVDRAKEDRKSRDVYLYVISGYKPHNPAAAQALIECLRK